MKAKAWSEKVIIPTYEIGLPEKNPVFLEKRVYQGSSGRVYPYAVVEKISNQKKNKEWLACFLENDYIKVMILPELGGRIQMAYDKIKNRHFVYYNEVIKPALVGLTGPWVSGGIEFNWPQHHRPSTYLPTEFHTEENEDGSKTIWCSEIEIMFRTKGMAGFTIYPDKAYLEIKVKLYNRTSYPQTFLWWANPAVAVNEHYQSVFPPDVHAVFDHGKRDVSKFPVATGTYYKVDYSAGVDISRYKNIPVPTSYMAIQSKYDFVGGYENDSQCGMLHVANHYISPGKKQWTWGNGDFGQAWDRNLTDKNGPYIELMCGVYTDNQPDFSWLMPYEEKSFSQFFMPYHGVGMVKNATKDILINLEFNNDKAYISIYTTSEFINAKIILRAGNHVMYEKKTDLSPLRAFADEIIIQPNISQNQYLLTVKSSDGNVLIEWKPEKQTIQPMPQPALAAKNPSEILTNEELYLNGLHIEQYRHATYNAEDYYQEVLNRDPNDIRCNNAMGLLLLRRGLFNDATTHFTKASNRLTLRNPNPIDGEPLFNLGLSLRFLEKDQQAYEAFHKAVWNASFVDSGYFHLAQIDAKYHRWDAALENIDRSLLRNWHNHKGRHLKVMILRKKEMTQQALELIEDSLKLDRFNIGLYFEKYLLGDHVAHNQIITFAGDKIQNYIEIALDYFWAGLFDEAIELLDLGIIRDANSHPMAYYFKAWIQYSNQLPEKALESIFQAEKLSPDYCFPNQTESVPALMLAIKLLPTGGKAPYYLGNFWYHNKVYQKAVKCWKKAAELINDFPTVHRNLALAYYNKLNQPLQALEKMELSFSLNSEDDRVFMELDQLHKKLNKPVELRLDLIEKHNMLVEKRDDLFVEKMELLLIQNQFSRVQSMVTKRKFSPWEGGEGKVTKVYTSSLIGLAINAIKEGEFSNAIKYLDQSKVYPHNLGEGKLLSAQENEIDLVLGWAYQEMGLKEKAIQYWQKASEGMTEPTAAWFYNDQQPDSIFFQGIALLKMSRQKEAMSCFNKLINYAEKHFFEKAKIDYFAVSLPDLAIWEDDLDKRNRLHCKYLMALGLAGKGNIEKAQYLTDEIRNEDLYFYGKFEWVENKTLISFYCTYTDLD